MINFELKLRQETRFRWVTCQLEVLANCSNLSELRKALHSLPTTLEETYDRILLSIRRECRSDVVELLQWLAFSVRPLTLLELAEVFAIDRDKLRFDPDRRPRKPCGILNNCSSLVKVSYTDDYDSVRKSGTLGLAHLSVKEYLISEQIRNSSLSHYHLDEKLANSAISRDCLLYLLQFDTVDCLCNESEASISFGRYAAEFWITHARSDDGVIQNSVQKLVTRLLSSSRVHFNNWITLFDADYGCRNYFLKTSHNVPSPLYYASLLGLGKIVHELALSSSADVNTAEGYDGSALASASARGHKEVVQILLENGADVNAAGGFYGSALASASANEHKELVQILLKNGANVNMGRGGGSYGSAMELLLAGSEKEIMQILLEKGADVNMAGGHYSSTLALALTRGREDIMRNLPENGADMNVAGGFYGSALASASAGGHKEVVKILLENEADVNIAGGHFGSALGSASTKGHKEVVQILLENGADVNVVGGFYGSALASASTGGHKEIVQILLESGADVNMAGGFHGSALGSASANGHKELVQILLKNGANVNITGGYHGNALESAITRGHEEIVHILQEWSR